MARFYAAEKKAYTVVEMLVAVGLFSIVMASFFGVLYVGRQSFLVDSGLMDLQQSGRRAIDGMTRELRESRASQITINANLTNVSFFVAGSNNSITYYLDNTTLYRTHPAGVDLAIGQDIQRVAFCCWHGGNCDDSCGTAQTVFIMLTAAKPVMNKTLNMTFLERVRLRNE